MQYLSIRLTCLVLLLLLLKEADVHFDRVCFKRQQHSCVVISCRERLLENTRALVV